MSKKIIKNLNELKKEYDQSCNDFVSRFAIKQGLEFDGWVGDEVGETALFNEVFYFNMSDVILDLMNYCENGLIVKWSEESTEFNMFKDIPKYINYRSYIRGLRYDNLN